MARYVGKFGGGKGEFVLRLHNKLSYMLKAYPNIAQTAVDAAVRGLEYKLNQAAERAAARANRQAA